MRKGAEGADSLAQRSDSDVGGGGMVVDRKLDEDTRTAEHSLLVTGTESKDDYE